LKPLTLVFEYMTGLATPRKRQEKRW